MNNKLMETNEKYSKVLHEMARIDAGVMKTSEVLGLLKKVREEFKIKNREYNEFGTISLWTLPPSLHK